MERPDNSRDRGAVVVESVLVMIPLVFFLFLAPAIWKMWAGEQHSREEAHRWMFMKAHVPMDVSDPAIPTWLWGSGTGRPRNPRLPTLRPHPEQTLRGYTTFKNIAIEGRHKETIRYSNGFRQFRGEIETPRWAYIIRSPWTWSAYPFTTTQDNSEKGKIHSWYKHAYDKRMTRSVLRYSLVDKRPL